jgi:hypothetical protein
MDIYELSVSVLKHKKNKYETNIYRPSHSYF